MVFIGMDSENPVENCLEAATANLTLNTRLNL